MSGKDGGWILPEEIDPERVCVKLFVPNDPAHLAAFWGALWNLTYWNQWQRDELKLGTQVAAVWKDVWFNARVINDGLEGCEIVPFDVRQNDEEPCILEKSEDGDTWVPFADLQLCPPNIVYTSDGGIGIPDGEGGITPIGSQPQPPVSGDNKACTAAASAVQVLVTLHQEILTRFDAGLTVLTIASAVATTLLILIAVPFAWIAIVEIVTLATGVLALITVDAFSEEIQEELKCILFCAATENEDGTVDFDFAEVTAAVEEKAIALDMWRAIQFYLSIVGSDGLNRAGATGVVTEAECDCPDCPTEWCYEWSDAGEVGTGWANWFGTQGSQSIGFEKTFTESEVIAIQFAYTWNGLGGGGTSAQGIWKNTLDVENRLAFDGALDNGFEWSGSPQTMHKIYLGANGDGFGAATITITSIRVRGIGTNPFGTDNCED